MFCESCPGQLLFCALFVPDSPSNHPTELLPPLMKELLKSMEVVAVDMLSLVAKMKKVGIYRMLTGRKVKIQFFQLHLFIWKMLLSKATYN